MFVALEDWLTASNLARRGEILLHDQRERFHTFAEIVVVIPRMWALMRLGSGGMLRYAAAGVAADKA
jgi:hypothetical protein